MFVTIQLFKITKLRQKEKQEMKRGKGGNDDKVGPMFPRLHVNDTTEKGGPRAPPRNKMALYEQFSVPFQRLNPNSHSSSSNSIPLTSSSTMVSFL